MKPRLSNTKEFYRNIEFLGILLLFILGILARMDTDWVTPDMQRYFIPWYKYIRDFGPAVAFRENFWCFLPFYRLVSLHFYSQKCMNATFTLLMRFRSSLPSIFQIYGLCLLLSRQAQAWHILYIYSGLPSD